MHEYVVDIFSSYLYLETVVEMKFYPFSGKLSICSILFNSVEIHTLFKNIGTRARTGSSEFGCPPPWVPFDKNIIDSENIEHKVTDVSKSIEPKAQNATAEFDMQRQENIKQALLANQNNPKKVII